MLEDFIDSETAQTPAVQSSPGEMPEYVIIKDGKRIPYTGQKEPGFISRARTDLVVICDGSIVDISAVKLPEGIEVIDHRSTETQQGPD